jgi:DNA sulfur modification protein DndB
MNAKWHVPSLRGIIGNWVVYPSLMSAKQISDHVMKSKDIRESKGLDDYLQRNLKPRVKKIVRYLKTRDSHFFNSILLGVFDAVPDWVEFDLSTVAEKLKIADVSETKQSMGLLTFSGTESIFAVDGQHRAEAISEAYKAFGDKIVLDQYPVIFLAHVDSAEGKVRTRRLFCDINKNAVAVSKGDKVIIDEDDLCAIVTRRIYADYLPFKKGKEIAVTEQIERVEKDGAEYFTSLLALYTVCKKLKKILKKAPGTIEVASENVKEFQNIVSRFFDYIIKLEPALNLYFAKAKTTPKKERKANRNLVFRPIGLEILARLYVHFYLKKNLRILDWGLANLRWENPGGILDGIVWLNGKIIPQARPKTAAVDYVLYLLHEVPDRKAAALVETLRELRNEPNYNLPSRAAIPKKILVVD